MAILAPIESAQCFGGKKTAFAVTHCKRGGGLIKINDVPIELVQSEILRYKAFAIDFSSVDMRIRVKGGGHTSQIYAIRQSISKAPDAGVLFRGAGTLTESSTSFNFSDPNCLFAGESA